mmetsp:Transcript_8931/g.19674  ORF Transcript_8931/g.19674 Transcript_8931/m.19674 type:complete len:287 (-) Transcript_8931:101-961(-)|eukprot:CAMPEP_0170624266 /NCGR_PEP_ID=MMETSP0224-20130122/30139_1 /TAXON_ID=285029 /ORGANISM="Togula jolla, Strain CCCM 725" /LENGTH=286 /DNA_ID=CAMNT_0010950773 /DNA_START=75 /DNA_END=935 /DNA_ORIENTATION=-
MSAEEPQSGAGTVAEADASAPLCPEPQAESLATTQPAEPAVDASARPMMQPLDTVLQAPEEVQDLQVVSRELAGGLGKFEALHNASLGRSLMTGAFECKVSTGGVTRYEGTFLNDPHLESPTPNGQGVRKNPDGSEYAGQWKDGRQDGHGEWRAAPPSCESYVGDWRRGKKHGFGTHKFENGDVYEGDWNQGLPDGRGKHIYANGDEFLGVWAAGVKRSGTIYHKDGRMSVRKWENGSLVSCQEYDSQRQKYQPTLDKSQAHDPARNSYGTQGAMGVLSPRGVRVG